MVFKNGIPIMFKDRSTVNHAMNTTKYGDLYSITDVKEYRRLCKSLAYHKFYYVKKRLSANNHYKVRILPENIFTMKL
tara:strand:- start:458 stop:691 length:234 start_codon:yes stop_codon:yes gene_type:complete